MLKFGMAGTCSGAFLAFVGEARGQLRNTFFPLLTSQQVAMEFYDVPDPLRRVGTAATMRS